MSKEKIVILGAGFAGLQLARRLSKTESFDITLIDRYNFHQFQPLFYQVATARIEPSNISFPLRKIFQHKKNVKIRVGNIEAIDINANTVITSVGNFDYDKLIIATGCTTNFFGNENIERFAFPMKSTMEAIALQNRILTNFEQALTATPERKEQIMNMVVVGGGPTGVELAGSLAEMKTKILPKDYPDMDFSQLKIYLLEGGPAVLGPMSEVSRNTAKRYLEELGVKVMLNSIVENYDGQTVFLKGGETIKTQNLIWAAGVTGNVPNGIEKGLIQRGNRIIVNRYNQVQGYDNIFAIGDIAYMETPLYPHAHPQVANVAINQAKLLSKNLLNNPSSWKEFEYDDPGSMATVGKRRAVVDLPKFSFQGGLAWLTWMFLHLMLILSVRNKLGIFINWAYTYITNDTTLRLILMPTRKHLDLLREQEYLAKETLSEIQNKNEA